MGFSVEFSPWAVVGDFLREEKGEGTLGEWEFARENGLPLEELNQVKRAASRLKNLSRRAQMLERVRMWNKPRALFEFVKAYRRVFSQVEGDEKECVNQALSYLNSSYAVIKLAESFPSSLRSRLAMGLLNYAIIAAGLKFSEVFEGVNALHAIGVNVLASIILSAVEYRRLEKGEWVISAGAQGLKIAGVPSIYSLVFVRLNTLARNLPMALVPELRPAAFLSGLGILLQAVLQGGVDLRRSEGMGIM